MSRVLSQSEINELVERLSQNYEKNMRVSETGPFPTLKAMRDLGTGYNCSTKFSKVYELDKIVKRGGASGAVVIELKTVSEEERLRRMQNVIGSLRLVVKKIPYSYDERVDDENFMDIVIGSRLNVLIASKIATGFMRTVDWFVCKDFVGRSSDPRLYAVLERLDYEIVSYLASRQVAEPELVLSLLAQLLCNLESAQKSIGYVHYDLHTGNVLVQNTPRRKLAEADYWSFTRPNGAVVYVSREATSNQEVKMIDFGRNRIRMPVFKQNPPYEITQALKTYNVEGYEEFGITRSLHQQHDMRRFSIHFVEQLYLKSLAEDTETFSAMSSTQIRQPDPTDYFEQLEMTDQRSYERLMDVLDAMSGYLYIYAPSKFSIFGDNSPAARDYQQRLKYLLSEYTKEEVEEAARGFAKGGMRWFLQELRNGNRKHPHILARLWEWTPDTFPFTVSDVLDMPYFYPLNSKPIEGFVVAEAMRYRPVLSRKQDLGPIANCAVCPGEPQFTCDCETVAYCSMKCYSKHFDEHLECDCPLST